MDKHIREYRYEIENAYLFPYAFYSANTAGRDTPEEECPIRTAFQVDRDRIIHSNSFRRLKHKTQVFLAPEGDHYRTRLTHTLEVSQIARTISRALRLNEDLTEAIAMGHDLGHTPFGHAGERALNEICPFGFLHYEQSVRVAQKLEKNCKGLNLTKEVQDGILHHTKGELPATLEGQVVRVSDRIAYLNHDIQDAIMAGIITQNDIPSAVLEHLGNRHSQRINTLVTSVVQNSGENIAMDSETEYYYDMLNDFMFGRVYAHNRAKAEETKAQELVKTLYRYFVAHPQLLADEYKLVCDKEGVERAVCDYIAGMTDQYAMELFSDLFIPKSWKG